MTNLLAALFFMGMGMLLMAKFNGGGEGVSRGDYSISAGLVLFMIGSLVAFGIMPFP